MQISRLGSGDLESNAKHSYNSVIRTAAAYRSGFVTAANYQKQAA